MKSERLSGKHVRDIAPYEQAVEVAEHDTIAQLVTVMTRHSATQHLCVVDEEGRLKGLVSRRKLFQAVFSRFVPGSIRLSELYTLKTSEKAGDLMVRHVLTATEEDRVAQVVRAMIEREISEVPVIGKNNEVLGLLTFDLFLRAWLSI